MDTFQEALFRDMLCNGWFCESDGDVESNTGYFGWMANSPGDWNPEFESAFSDTIETYGADTEINDEWLKENFVGVWTARINSNGIITIRRVGDYDEFGMGVKSTLEVRSARLWFEEMQSIYLAWAGDDDI